MRGLNVGISGKSGISSRGGSEFDLLMEWRGDDEDKMMIEQNNNIGKL